jgi:hypothetical protein
MATRPSISRAPPHQNQEDMMRKIIALAATALLCSLVATGAASARMGGMGGHPGGMGGFHGGMGAFHGGMGAFHAGPVGGFRAGPAFTHSNVAFHHHAFVHNRFFFRHHRFHHRFVTPFIFASVVDDSCFIVRRVWTPWGWHWRRVWVCG